LQLNSPDNPYYFCNDTKSPRTPDSQSSSRGFSIFKRRNSKGSSPRPLVMTNPEQMRLITSANLDTTATMALGSPRGSFNSLAGYPQVSSDLIEHIAIQFRNTDSDLSAGSATSCGVE